jgi:hypothetical protein
MADEDGELGAVPWAVLARDREIRDALELIPSAAERLAWVGSLLATEQDDIIRRGLHGHLKSLHLEMGNGQAARAAALEAMREFPDSMETGSAGFIFAMTGDAAAALEYFRAAYRLAVEAGMLVTSELVTAAHTLAVLGMTRELDAYLALVVETGVVKGEPDCAMEWAWSAHALERGASAELIGKLKALFGSG